MDNRQSRSTLSLQDRFHWKPSQISYCFAIDSSIDTNQYVKYGATSVVADTIGPMSSDPSSHSHPPASPEALSAAARQMLDAYLRRIDGLGLPGASLLSGPDIVRWSLDLRSHPLLRRLDGLVLDDPRTSNHHLLATAPPLAGAVVHLSHDGDSRVVFADVEGFLDAVQRAAADDREVEDFHPSTSPPAGDQAGLGALIRALLASPDDEDTAVAFIPSLDLRDTGLLRELASHENFFVAEALAVEIAKRPSEALREIASMCAAHAHPQAANAGQRAVAAVERWARSGQR